uniref:Uncharacterized protein n=1 Tax=Opuntia streptacantha TaxID=393608 RepID=A0A7C8YDM3_OPUST
MASSAFTQGLRLEQSNNSNLSLQYLTPTIKEHILSDTERLERIHVESHQVSFCCKRQFPSEIVVVFWPKVEDSESKPIQLPIQERTGGGGVLPFFGHKFV